MTDNSRDARLFWTTAVCVIVLDVVTKYLAVHHLLLYFPKRIVGNVVRFTLAYNPGAAFSMSLGHPMVSRVAFGAFAMIALVVLWRLYRFGPANEPLRVFAAALAFGGAAGNLIDRIISTKGVVDFIDIGVGTVRFWTFNIADSGVSVGAVLLAIVIWREDMRARAAETSASPSGASAGQTGGADVLLPPTIQ